MSPERYRALNSPANLSLTKQEMREGWHFCCDWDFLMMQINKAPEYCGCKPWTEAQIERLGI